MLTERVRIDITANEDVDDSSKAVVDAQFVFRNLGYSDENMETIFPITDINSCYNDYFYEVFKPTFKVEVDGQPIQSSEISTLSQIDENCSLVNWMKFEIHFPARKEVRVDINYTMYESDHSQ